MRWCPSELVKIQQTTYTRFHERASDKALAVLGSAFRYGGDTRDFGNRTLVVDKSPYERLVEGVHNLTNGDAQAHISNEHCKVLSMDNGEIHTSEMWFSNSVVAEQRTASPLLVGDSALLDDEIWPEFLSQPTPQSDVDMRDVPGSPLSDKTQEGLHPLACHTSKNIGEALDEIHTAESTSETKNFVHSNIASELSSSVKTKVVRWPEAILLGKEFKRQRSGIQSTSSNDIKDNSCPNRARPVQCALVQFDTTLPQDFQHIREHALKGKILSEIATVHESESKSLCLDGVEFEVSQAGVNVSTKSISETAGASSGSDKLKDHTTADNNVGHFDMPVKFATTQVLTGSNFLSNESLEKDHNLSANIPSSKDLLPFGQVKNGTAPKSHHVQLVERHTGFRMISTAGAFADARLPRESRWAEELLLECALAISSKNVVRTQHLMWVLNDLGCLTGDANQRLAAHGLKSLFCKVTGTGDAAGFNPTLGHVNGGAKTVHRALLKFHDVNPWHHMVYTVANSVMIDNFEGEEKVHVVDIGVSQGTQWPTFIEALATRASGPPLLRLTVVKDDEGAATPRVPQGSSSTDFMVQLERFAKLMGIQIELHTVVSSLEKLTRRKLGLKEGEALAICAQFRLHRLPEATGQGELGEVSLERGNPGLSPRDKFLQFMHELQPKVVILSENDTDHLDSDFVTRFRPTVDYLWKFLDSTSYSFHGKHSQERQIIEYEAAMAMVNNVACEGSHRIERNESHRGWTRRMERAGFVPVLPREEILDNIRTLVMKYDTNWEFGTDLNCVVLLWKHQPVTFCSVWKPM